MKQYKYEDFSKMVLPHSAKLSPNGMNVAFLARIPDVESNSYLSKLYVTNCKTGNTKKLTNFGTDGKFDWVDDNTIIFPGLREEKDKKAKEKGELLTVFYEISIDGGEAERAFAISIDGATANKIDKDNYLIRAVFDNAYPDLTGLKGKKRDEALAQFKENKDYEVADEFPYRFDGMGYINKKRNRLYIYNKATGKLNPITDKLFSTDNALISADKSGIYFSGELLMTDSSNTDGIYYYDIAQNTVSELVKEGKYTVSLIAELNDSIYFVGNVHKDIQTIGEMQLWKLDIKTKQLEIEYVPVGDFGFGMVTDGINGNGYSMIGANGKLYFVETRRYGCALYELEGDKAVKISSDELQIASFDIKEDNIIAIGIEYNEPSELYSIKGESFYKLTSLNKKFNSAYQFSKPQRLTFTNSDGIEIDGWVIEPYGYEKGKKYPGYLEIHGGPRANYGRELMLDLQFIAHQGYFVFYANPRGSSARGNDFANINGKYGTVDYKDLMEFTDEALKKYKDIDEKRLGVGGGSYGGFMSNWIIGQTNRFKAAIPQCSISNWITMYGCSDIPKFCMSQMDGTPWDNYEGFWEASPLKYANKVKTPTLFLQYGDDFRCPMQEAVQMYTALMLHKVETRLVIFHGNSHKMRSLGKPTQRNRRCREILEWLDKYVKQA